MVLRGNTLLTALIIKPSEDQITPNANGKQGRRPWVIPAKPCSSKKAGDDGLSVIHFDNYGLQRPPEGSALHLTLIAFSQLRGCVDDVHVTCDIVNDTHKTHDLPQLLQSIELSKTMVGR